MCKDLYSKYRWLHSFLTQFLTQFWEDGVALRILELIAAAARRGTGVSAAASDAAIAAASDAVPSSLHQRSALGCCGAAHMDSGCSEACQRDGRLV